MKALIYRDIRAFKFFYLTLLIVMILYAYLNIRFGSVDGIIGFLVILMPSVSGIILFVGDNGLIPLFASLPVNRKDLVIGKYVSTYLIGFMLISFIFLITWYLSTDYVGAQNDLGSLLSIQGLLFSVSPITVIVGICYPLLFRFGMKIGVRIIMGGFGVFYCLGMVIFERVIKATIPVERRGVFRAAMAMYDHLETLMNPCLLYSMLIACLLLLLTVSIILSIKWFSQKDL